MQLRLKREQEARDKAEEERLISLMKKKFAEDETREREEAARRKKDKERVRPPTQTDMDTRHSCRARACWHLLTICDVCVRGVQYQQLVRQQQEANRVLFETEKEQAVVDQKASEEYEEFRKKVRGVAQ